MPDVGLTGLKNGPSHAGLQIFAITAIAINYGGTTVRGFDDQTGY
jgi:hypothetical protein